MKIKAIFFAKLCVMIGLMSKEFDSVYEELSLLNEAKNNADPVKLAWFRYLFNHESELYDLLANKIDFDTFYKNAVASSESIANYNKIQSIVDRCKQSYELLITQKAIPVKSAWYNLSEFASISKVRNNPALTEWFGMRGIYIIRQISTGRLYIGKAFGLLTERNSLVRRMQTHYSARKSDSTFHSLIAKNRNDFECAILEIVNNLEAINSAEINAIEKYKTFYNIFDFNMKPGGEGGSVISKNYPEVIAKVKEMLIKRGDNDRPTDEEIANEIKDLFEYATYNRKNVYEIKYLYGLGSKEHSLKKSSSNWKVTRKPVELYNIKTDKLEGSFDSLSDAARYIAEQPGVSSSVNTIIGHLGNIARGRRANGYYIKVNEGDTNERI